MNHLGDITKIHDPPRAEVVIGGSPCQDLSFAGKRAGLAGERSGLFMEQIRLIKEMRDNDIRAGRTDTDVFPRFMVWENVPGALSSNRGEDFRAVLEETVRVADKNAAIPRYEGGSWRASGVIMGNGFSVAWRVHDAQFWGVPQRRRRIALVADFGGHAAPEILFEREGVPGDSEPRGKAGEGFAADAPGRAYPSVAGTLRARVDGSPCLDRGTGAQIVIQGNCIDRADTAGCNGRGWREDVCYTLNTIDRPAVFDARGNGDGDTVPTLTGDHMNRVTDYTAVCVGSQDPEIAGTLDASYYKGTGARNGEERTVVAIDGRNLRETDVNGTITSKERGYNLNSNTICRDRMTVRRLTPLEWERLQGYPDGWTDIGDWTDSRGKLRKTSDSARYKALGNSIALPFWDWMLRRLNGYCRAHTMASLFDGIGGFPLIWERINGRGSCLWSSEIEEFPIAVTKYHFGEETV